MVQDTSSQSDPGRTPGSAEGDLETVEEDLKEKGLEDDSDQTEQQSNDDEQQS